MQYGLVLNGRLVASVERKSLVDLVASLNGGKLRYQVADLATLPRAAVVVEDRYSQVFKLDHVRPAMVADGLAELQIRWPNVPVVFCETRQLAEEWTYRFLAAAHAWAITEHAALQRISPTNIDITELDRALAAPQPSTSRSPICDETAARLGINLLGARNSAIQNLVAEVPPALVAELLGYSNQVAQRHAEVAAQPWSRYAT